MTTEERIGQLEAENATLREQLAQALGRIQELEGRLAKDSHNSSKPPASDGVAHKRRSQRKPGDKKSGGQAGHAGHHLELVETPDEVIRHRPAVCAHCQQELSGVPGQVKERRQVQDLPEVRLLAREHLVEEVLQILVTFESRCMRNQETIELRVFHPKQKAPTALKNIVLEGFVRDVVSHSNLDDLRMRFFGNPNVEAIPGRITGRIPDKYEQPRDTVIVVFENRRPVGYTDISRFSGQTETAEISMLVRTDRQRRGIGKAMMQEAVRELRDEGVKQLETYIHPENSKMNRALEKWSRTEELQYVTFRKTLQEGEVVYFIDLEA